MPFEVAGMSELDDALAAIPGRLDAASREGLIEGARLMVDETRRLLEQRSHPRHTRTPSPPGSPPARIDGDLADSVHADPEPSITGMEASISVTTDLAYSDIQEHGGRAGRGHRSVLPARPFMRPAMDTVAPRVAETLADAWMKAITT